MSLTRRRFIALSAAALAGSAGPSGAAPVVRSWRGRALGAEVVVVLRDASEAQVRQLGARIAARLDRLERALSLHRASELVRLNETGVLAHPSADMAAMLMLADRLHATTQGAFDASVQAHWRACALGAPMRAPFGWERVVRRGASVRLPEGMALTFNGVAQGHAADVLAALIREAGFHEVVVDAGEIAARGAPWPVEIRDEEGARAGRITLTDSCLATSSPRATRIGPDGAPHILHPDGRLAPWRTVSVSAPTAAVADGLSTAFCLMERATIDASLGHWPGARLVLAVPAKTSRR